MIVLLYAFLSLFLPLVPSKRQTTKDPRCRFTNIQKQLTAPFVIYADFESVIQRVDEAMDTTQGAAVGDDEPTAA